MLNGSLFWLLQKMCESIRDDMSGWEETWAESVWIIEVDFLCHKIDMEYNLISFRLLWARQSRNFYAILILLYSVHNTDLMSML